MKILLLAKDTIIYELPNFLIGPLDGENPRPYTPTTLNFGENQNRCH